MKKLLILFLFLYSTSVSAATYCRIAKFIKQAEGGLAHLPEGTTLKGVIYEKTWVHYFGNSYQRFLRMSDEDWNYIFVKGYWNVLHGDSINSQEIAEYLQDWVWMSGSYTPAKKVQKILNIPQTGKFDKATIQAINNANATELRQQIDAERLKFMTSLALKHPKDYEQFENGWLNRNSRLVYMQFFTPIDSCSHK